MKCTAQVLRWDAGECACDRIAVVADRCSMCAETETTLLQAERTALKGRLSAIDDRLKTLKRPIVRVVKGTTTPHNGTETSVAAARSMEGSANILRLQVFKLIRRSGTTGMTCDEVECESGLRHQTASARVNELAGRGDLVDSGSRRKTRSGRLAIVWFAKEAAT